MEMHKLIARLEKNELCDIFLRVSMKLNNAKYQRHYCLGEPETIKVFKDEGIIIFTVRPLLPLPIGKKFQVKITLEESEIFFYADRIYDDRPTQKFELKLSLEKKIYVLTGFDDLDDIELFFQFPWELRV